MKKRIADRAKKSFALCFLICGFLIFAHAQTTTLDFKGGKAAVKKIFQPTKQTDADFYYIYLRKYQKVEISVNSNSLYLTKENECGVYFQMFDEAGEEFFLGDSPSGIDRWQGEIKEPGIYKIKVYMNCLESFTTKDLRRKKPRFRYALEILGSKIPVR